MGAIVSDESRAVSAVLRFAARSYGERRSAEETFALEVDDEDFVGMCLARDHGVNPEQVSAYKSLGRSRGLALDEVLRAAFRNELRDVVALPPVERRRRR